MKKQQTKIQLPAGCVHLSKKSLIYQNHFQKVSSDNYEVYYEDSKQIVFKIKKEFHQEFIGEVKYCLISAREFCMMAASKLLKLGNKNRLEKLVKIINDLDKI